MEKIGQSVTEDSFYSIYNTFPAPTVLDKEIQGPWLKRLDPGGIPHTFFVKPCSGYVSGHLTRRVAMELRRPMVNLAAFYRMSSRWEDAEFRIHADGKFNDDWPTWASVTYLDTQPGTGTALFEHPHFGGRWRPMMPMVHQMDDGQWEEVVKFESFRNATFIYRADLWHSKYPYNLRVLSAMSRRVVLVNFMKESE